MTGAPRVIEVAAERPRAFECCGCATPLATLDGEEDPGVACECGSTAWREFARDRNPTVFDFAVDLARRIGAHVRATHRPMTIAPDDRAVRPRDVLDTLRRQAGIQRSNTVPTGTCTCGNTSGPCPVHGGT